MDVQKGELDFLLNNSGSHIITRNEVNQNIRHLKTNWLFFCDLYSFFPTNMDFWNNIDFKKTYAAWSIYFLPWFQIYMQVEKQNNLGVAKSKRLHSNLYNFISNSFWIFSKSKSLYIWIRMWRIWFLFGYTIIIIFLF